MLNALTVNDPVTPEWLTLALVSAGALTRGEVVAVEARGSDAFNSAVAHLTVAFSDDAPDDAPRALFLKRNLPVEWAIEAGRDEVAFYQAVAPHAARLPMLIPCYVALADEARGASTLVMPDVSATHAPPLLRDDQIAGRSIPDPVALDQAIDALAAFHAFWLQRPDLRGQFILTAWTGDADLFQAHVARRRAEWARFIAAEGAWFPADLRDFYERELECFPALWNAGLGEAMASGRGLTLAHGDCYLTQFLCPRPGVAAPTYLVDFQSATVDLPGADLIHMFAFCWSREQRREGDLELRSLRRYHAGLLAGGVRDFSWEDLLAAYRWALTVMLFYAVWHETNGSPRSYWYPQLQHIVAAWQDHCQPGS
jgi:ecdysteroid kinase